MIHDLKPYSAYKDSSVPWMGEIPNTWRVLRGKNVFRVIDVRSETGNEELLTVSSKDGVVPRSQKTVTMFKAESYVGHKLCWPGDLVINSLWAWMQGLGFTKIHGLVSSAYSVYRPLPEFSSYTKYFDYALRSAAYKWELQTRSKGVWLSRLQLSDPAFLDMPIIIPPADEQSAIVHYLDHFDRRIRHYIRAKKKLIKLLEEQKQAIIHQAVTRGLDPNVKLKPSGVEWLGDVPEHWEVVALRRYWEVVDCKHITVPFTDEGIHIASVREVQSFDLNLSTSKKTNEEWYAHMISGGRRPKKGDLIYCRNVSVGACAFVTSDETFAMGQDVCLIRSETENGRFLNYFMRSLAMQQQLSLVLIGSTFHRINVSEIKSLLVAVPPRNEQDLIVSSLDASLSKLDKPIELAQKEISLLREYRTRLIADVVTGKLDVREAAANLSDKSDEIEVEDDFEEETIEESLEEVATEEMVEGEL